MGGSALRVQRAQGPAQPAPQPHTADRNSGDQDFNVAFLSTTGKWLPGMPLKPCSSLVNGGEN